MRNFAFPYFSRDIAEFWRRWHISLSSWFKSYVYIPLGGSHGGKWLNLRNTFVVFTLSGLWHGANWTFIIWGVLNALYFMPLLLAKRNRQHLNTVAEGRLLPTAGELIQMLATFGLTTFAWIFFRATSVQHAWQCISTIFSSSLFTFPQVSIMPLPLFTALFLIIEWAGREQQFALQTLGCNWPRACRRAFYYGIMLTILYYYGDNQQQFIYFQF
jgi:D-alanyl-lipoteichoic acid acyltransferase DltB (MBOAT superfamily)